MPYFINGNVPKSRGGVPANGGYSINRVSSNTVNSTPNTYHLFDV